MKKTRLIQRLRQPTGVTNPFSFGMGGSGLSTEAEDLVVKVWSWDYMSAAEFEHGEVQIALEKIYNYVKAGSVVTGTVDLSKGRQVYFLAQQGTEIEVEQLIRQLSQGEGELGLKKTCGLRYTLEGFEDAKNTVGWLELDNGFMFFTDKTMYENALGMFGYKPQSESVVDKLRRAFSTKG